MTMKKLGWTSIVLATTLSAATDGLNPDYAIKKV